MLTREQVLHVATLSRLALTDEEVERYAHELSSVLDHIETISELDLDGVERLVLAGGPRQVGQHQRLRPARHRCQR